MESDRSSVDQNLVACSKETIDDSSVVIVITNESDLDIVLRG